MRIANEDILSSNISSNEMSGLSVFSTVLRWPSSLLYCCTSDRYSLSICESTMFMKRLLSSPESLTRDTSSGETITTGSSPICSEMRWYGFSSRRSFFSPFEVTLMENLDLRAFCIRYVPDRENPSAP